MSKVKLEILGNNYLIDTSEDEEYCKSLAEEINSQVGAFMQANPKISAHDALILCTLGCYDSYHKSEQACDHLRTQVSSYLAELNGKKSFAKYDEEQTKF